MAVLAALAGCQARSDSGTIVVSAIGAPPALVDPARGASALPSRLLIDGVAQGLVRFDAAGQIEPGLAQRWIVTDGGMSYIFRLADDARWADRSPVTADQVAARLRRLVAPGSRDPLAPFLTAVDDVVAMTPQVVEVRLKRPRPDLLKLFAQPELAMIGPARAGGTGPLAVVKSGAAPLLRPLLDPARDGEDAPAPAVPPMAIRLRGERAATAIARFQAGAADLVTGGSLADWPLVVAAQPAPTAIRTDPAAGLFGLTIVNRAGFLADPANRAAVAEALDRSTLVTGVPGWAATERLLPDQLDSAAPPQSPAWTTAPLAQRRADAQTRVSAWIGPVTLRVALPAGAGVTELWAWLAANLRAVGIRPARVALTEPADLRLLDSVAPYDSARWYLASACRPCGADVLAAVLAARDAPTLAERAQRIAAADAALAADTAFIPLARPFRWSLVSPRLRAWQPNPRAWHPLNRLSPDPT